MGDKRARFYASFAPDEQVMLEAVVAYFNTSYSEAIRYAYDLASVDDLIDAQLFFPERGGKRDYQICAWLNTDQMNRMDKLVNRLDMSFSEVLRLSIYVAFKEYCQCES